MKRVLKKILATFTLSLFGLNLALPAYALEVPSVPQDQQTLPVEHPAGKGQEAVDSANILLDLMAAVPAAPATAAAAVFQTSYISDFKGTTSTIFIDGTRFTFTDPQGNPRTGHFDPSKLIGTMIVVEGNRQSIYLFQFKSTPGAAAPMALANLDFMTRRLGGKSVLQDNTFQSYGYADDGALISYRSVTTVGSLKIDTAIAPLGNDGWVVSCDISAGLERYYGKAVMGKEEIKSMDLKSWLVQAVSVYPKSYLTRERSLKDTTVQVESVRSLAGNFEAKLGIITDTAGHETYYILNPGQTQHQRIIQNQSPIGLANTTAFYGESFENGLYQGYGLVIRNSAGSEVVIDYPRVKEVRIGSKTYDILLDESGRVEFKERILPAVGQVSPYQTNTPANLVQWDLMYYPTQDSGVPPVPGGDDLDRIEIYRQAPGSSDKVLIATLDHLTNQYLDTDVDTDHAMQTGYVYTVYITIKSGVRRFIPSGMEKINYGRDAQFAEGDLRPENVLVLASSVNSVNGRQKSLLGDGTDLVNYYVNARGIPASNVLRLNVEDNYRFTDYNDLKTRVLDPIYNYLVANNLTDQITAFTTMPGTHMTYRGVRPQGFGLVYDNVPLESIISDSIPKMIRGEKPSYTFQTSSVNGGRPFEDIYNYRFAPAYDQPDLDTLLQNNLGYTRMAAPATSTLTAQQNLKRMIDQGIAAENKARIAAENGVSADHYAFIFDSKGAKIVQTDLFGSSPNYGDYRFQSAEKMLRDFGYSTYLDKNEATLDTSNTVKDAEFLADLASGDKELYGYAGWYFPGNGNQQDDPTDRYNPIYNYVESLSPNGFADGSFITPLDSDRESGWFALKRDGVVMAVNAQEEPFIDGLADLVGAYVYTGTSLAFASVKAQKYTHWMANVFGDPLFNMGKHILGTPQTTVVNGTILTTQIVQAGKVEAGVVVEEDYINGPRVGLIQYSYDSTGRIVHARLSNGGEEFYNADGTKIYRNINGTEILEFDKQGRIVKMTKISFNPVTQLNETTVKTYSY